MSRQLVCACGRAFETEAQNRRKCYVCSPARIVPKSGVVVPINGAIPPQPDQPFVPITPETPAAPPEPGRIELAAIKTLTELNWLETLEGALVLALAADLDGTIPGAQRSSMTKQLGAMLDEIRARAPRRRDQTDDVQDAIRAKREQA